MFLPLPPHDRAEEIQPISAFTAKKVVSLKRSLSTSTDTDEKAETLS